MAKPRPIKLQDLATLGNNSQEILRKIVAPNAPELKQVEAVARRILDENYNDVQYSLTVDYASISTDEEIVRVRIAIPTHQFGLVATYPLATTLEEIQSDLSGKIGHRLPV